MGCTYVIESDLTLLAANKSERGGVETKKMTD